MERCIYEAEGILAQIKGAKEKAFHEAVKVAAENLAECDPQTNFTDGEMVFAKCHGNFTRNVVYL